MNMKEQPELLTQEEYNEICMEMLAFQEANNRLTYDEGAQGESPAADTVEDKSFNLVEDDEEVIGKTPESNPILRKDQEGGLMDSARNLFRS